MPHLPPPTRPTHHPLLLQIARVVADTNCVVSCPQCTDTSNADGQASTQTMVIAGLASALLIMFCALVFVLVKGCCSNKYSPLSTHGVANENVVYANMLDNDFLEDL